MIDDRKQIGLTGVRRIGDTVLEHEISEFGSFSDFEVWVVGHDTVEEMQDMGDNVTLVAEQEIAVLKNGESAERQGEAILTGDLVHGFGKFEGTV